MVLLVYVFVGFVFMYFVGFVRMHVIVSNWLFVIVLVVIFFEGFLYRRLAKGLGRNTVIKWCIATAGSRFWMFNATFLKHSLKVHNGSLFSCRMLLRDKR